MKLDITDWMSLTGRIRTDNATINYTRKLSASTNTLFASKYGSYLNRTMTHNNLYGDVLSIDKASSTMPSPLQFNLGASIMDDKNQLTGYRRLSGGHSQQVHLQQHHLRQLAGSFPTQEKLPTTRFRPYATMQLGWRGMLSLTFRSATTGPRCWPSRPNRTSSILRWAFRP